MQLAHRFSASPGPLWHDEADSLPAAPGSYLLLISLSGGLQIERPLPARLDAGWYIYSGSARGRGGPRSRARRHFRRDKPVRWHIDQLTNRADRILAAAFEAYGECELLEGLAGGSGWCAPVPGFGSSDCKTCPAHLLRAR